MLHHDFLLKKQAMIQKKKKIVLGGTKNLLISLIKKKKWNVNKVLSQSLKQERIISKLEQQHPHFFPCAFMCSKPWQTLKVI